MERVEQISTPFEAASLLRMEAWVLHRWRDNVQQIVKRSIMKNMANEDVVLFIDYAENFKVAVEGQTGDAHFREREWAVLPVMVFTWSVVGPQVPWPQLHFDRQQQGGRRTHPPLSDPTGPSSERALFTSIQNAHSMRREPNEFRMRRSRCWRV